MDPHTKIHVIPLLIPYTCSFLYNLVLSVFLHPFKWWYTHDMNRKMSFQRVVIFWYVVYCRISIQIQTNISTTSIIPSHKSNGKSLLIAIINFVPNFSSFSNKNLHRTPEIDPINLTQISSNFKEKFYNSEVLYKKDHQNCSLRRGSCLYIRWVEVELLVF